MAEFQRMPTQEELQKILYMGQMQGKTTQEIINENLNKGGTIKPLPENFFTTASAGAKRAGDYINRAGTAADVAKLFPGYQPETKVTIPTSFNVVPKMDPYSGQLGGTGINTQQMPIGNVLQQIKPADVLGVSGAERAYGDIGAGKAPQPFDVVDTLGLGAGGIAAGKGLLGVAKATKGMPVGLSIKETTGLLETAPKSDIGFYSAVENAAMASPRKSATGQAFLNDIMKGQDVRADEIKWMGLDDYLKDKKSITKQEVQDYIANNRVDVKEIQLGEQLGSINRNSKYATPEVIRIVTQNQGSADNAALMALDNDFNAYKEITSKFPELKDDPDWAETVLSDVTGTFENVAGLPKFSQYTLPGGENYREILLTMPAKKLTEAEARNVLGAAPDAKLSEADIAYASRKNADEYRSSHFDQPNILAHLRVNDRVDADGKKMLLIEEVQSDWHQAGRDKGYGKKLVDMPEMSADELYDKHFNELSLAQKEYLEGFMEKWDSAANYGKDEELNKLMGQYNKWTSKQTIGSDIPDAPFKDTWYQLALKRAIQHAAENGYDRIGLTTGSQQAARFDLSKQLNSISYRDGVLKGYDKNNNLVINEFTEPKDLSNYVGKDLASKMVEKSTKTAEIEKKLSAAIYNKAPQSEIDALRSELTKSEPYFSGLDLQVGGEGMKKYYDEIYPKFLDKYGKKWGAKVGETKVNTVMKANPGSMIPKMDQEPVRYIDITPEMKAGVSKGQPLFMAAPIGVTGGLLGTEQDQRK